jgi:signal transduction histidine kinase
MKLARKHHPEASPPHEDNLDALLLAARAASLQSSAGFEGALDAILSAALGLLNAEEGSIQLIDRPTLTLVIAASRGLETPVRDEVVGMGQGIAGTVAVTGQPLLLAGAVDISRFAGHIPKDRKIFSAICVPLRAGGVTIGVLSADRMTPGMEFGERDLKVAQLFAETAALSIANAHLVAESDRRAVELEMLRGAGLRIGSSLDVDEVAAATLSEALGIAGTDVGFICVTTGDDEPLEIARYTGISQEELRRVVGSLGFRRLSPPFGTKVIGDVAADPVLAPLADAVEGRALALLNLRTADGRSDGVLAVALERDDDDLRELLGTFAAQAGLSLSNALLHRDSAGHQEELTTIITSLDLPIILIDEQDRFRSISPAAALAFRLSPEFELGHHARGKLPPEIEELVLDTADSVDEEITLRIGSEDRTVRLTVATTGTGRGAGGRIMVCTDVSLHRELEQKKADFLAVIGHELRTPLTNIKGYAATLAERGDTLHPEVRNEAVSTILHNSERLERLIEDLLYISRVDHHRPPLDLASDDLVAIASDVIGYMSRRAPDRIIQIEGTSGELPVYTDRVKVEQILTHLIDNGLKFSSNDTIVRVRIGWDADAVWVAVHDNGSGIYSGDLDRIFEPFAQIDSSSTRSGGGTGVGLYVCATLADALGGHVGVDSVLGKGSTFTLVLPRTSSAD